MSSPALNEDPPPTSEEEEEDVEEEEMYDAREGDDDDDDDDDESEEEDEKEESDSKPAATSINANATNDAGRSAYTTTTTMDSPPIKTSTSNKTYRCRVCSRLGLSAAETVLITPCHCVLCKNCMVHHLATSRATSGVLSCKACRNPMQSHYLERPVVSSSGTSSTANKNCKQGNNASLTNVEGVEYSYVTDITQLWNPRDRNLSGAPSAAAKASSGRNMDSDDDEDASDYGKKKRKRGRPAGSTNSSIANQNKITNRRPYTPKTAFTMESARHANFYEHCRMLKAHVAEFGSTQVTNAQNALLARWLNAVKSNKIALNDERKQWLQEAGFDLSSIGISKFQLRYDTLAAFVKRNGHADLTTNNAANEIERQVAQWLTKLRSGEINLKPDSVRKQQLLALGARMDREWKRPRTNFQQRVAALQRFKAQHGHLNIPSSFAGDRNLGSWVKDIRGGRLKVTKEQRAQLNTVGFVWETRTNALDRQWNDRFARIQHHLQTYGDLRNISDKTLAEWTSTQKKLHAKGSLRLDRLDRLDAIGFFDNHPPQQQQPQHQHQQHSVQQQQQPQQHQQPPMLQQMDVGDMMAIGGPIGMAMPALPPPARIDAQAGAIFLTNPQQLLPQHQLQPQHHYI